MNCTRAGIDPNSPGVQMLVFPPTVIFLINEKRVIFSAPMGDEQNKATALNRSKRPDDVRVWGILQMVSHVEGHVLGRARGFGASRPVGASGARVGRAIARGRASKRADSQMHGHHAHRRIITTKCGKPSRTALRVAVTSAHTKARRLGLNTHGFALIPSTGTGWAGQRCPG